MNPARVDPAVTYADTYFHMVRATYTDASHVDLPPGYRFRTYQPGDEAHWTALHRAAEPYIEITDALFDEQFGDHVDQLADRMFYVVANDGAVVGSATAWWQDDPAGGAPAGMVHWVVVDPDHQGQGLSKAMLTRVMTRLAASHTRAMLGTSSGRPWAIKVYLDFGFRPDPTELDDLRVRQGWADVQGVLNHPALRYSE